MNDSSALYAFNRFGDTVLRTAFAMTGSYQDAEDITQEVFLTLHSKPQEFDTEEHMKAWLIRSAINRCKNYFKSARVRKNSPLDEELANTLSCEFTPRDNEIREKIKKLPEKYSSVIFLYYFEEYSIKEIGEILGKNENTVSSILQRGRRKLKTELEKEGYIYET
ncbi:RNA polymerase sigma factor [Ruminococcus flavefaciens]|uniref:RNA polymerase sigma factor n=1 Tax=Ruminococcus flavefaciens TaxID=1265 RepID=UPI00031B5243|nr:RNA polymerase sigma factor [Ruminococcus flavefaciens]